MGEATRDESTATAQRLLAVGSTLCERLPAVAKVFVRGVIDFRMVAMIMARTENVEDGVIAELDASIAGRAEKWMKLSKPKLRDRIDMWVAKMDPAGVRVPPVVDDHRYLDVDPGAAAGMAFVSGHIHAADGAALDARLEALAATVCEHDPRTKAAPRGWVWAVGARGGHPGVSVRPR
jgi:hypothetical protein